MSTCQAKVGEYNCGLLPLRDGLCEKHYSELNNGNPVNEQQCIDGWGPPPSTQLLEGNNINKHSFILILSMYGMDLEKYYNISNFSYEHNDLNIPIKVHFIFEQVHLYI